MADGEVRAEDLTQETSSTLNGSEQFVMFDSVEGKRCTIDAAGTYITGDKTNLVTTEKGSIVGAINEVKGDANNLKEDINNIAEDQTLFMERLSSNYAKVLPADVDSSAKTYTGYYINSTGAISQNAGFNSYAFKCPYDGFKFKTSAIKIYTAETYPNTSSPSITLKSVIYDGTTASVDTERTISNKGDIVILSIGTAASFYLWATYNNPVTVGNLVVSNTFDSLKKQSVEDTGTTNAGNEFLGVVKVPDTVMNTASAGYSANASYDTYYFQVKVPELTVKCTNGFRAGIGYDTPSTASPAINLKTLLYSNESERVETFTAKYNEYVVISVGHARGEINLETDYLHRFTLPLLKLGFRQQNNFFNYGTSGTARYLHIYTKSGDKYVRYRLHNAPSVAINSNTWQLGAIYGYSEDLKTGTEIVGGGEFELAFKEYGADDYCGGNNHGDENTITFTLFIDGKETDLSTLDGAFHAFNRIDAIETAYVNRCDTPGDNILKHQKIWTFENGTVKIRQTLEFLQSLQCDWLCCMMAANRSEFPYGVRQGRIGVEDMTSSSFERVTTEGNEMMYLMYGDDNTAKVTAKTQDHTPVCKLWINNAATVNKLYYNFFGIPNTSVSSGTVYQWESEYDLAYN